MHTTLRTAVFGLLLITALPLLGDAPRIITIMTSPTEPPAQLRIEAYEAFRVVSSKIDGPCTLMRVTKESHEFLFTKDEISGTILNSGGAPNVFIPPKAIMFSGPATLQLSTTPGCGAADQSITVEITPQSFPPDKTILVPPGTNQVSIVLECSTNLVQWVTATNGIYGSPTEAKFFRIKAQPAN